MQPLMPTGSSPSSLYAANVAQMNAGINSMSLGTGMGRPMQMSAQPMQPMGMNPQATGMNAQPMRMHPQAMGQVHPQPMGMSATMQPSMGMGSTQSALNYGNSATYYNYQQTGMRMPMQTQMYQSQMQGTMGQFRS